MDRVCRSSAKVRRVGNVLGRYIGASTEGERVKGVSTWRANPLSEGVSPLKGERLP